MGDEMPVMVCPRCGAEYEDFDGFGVVFCERCRYCRHLARSINDGRSICDYCGEDKRDA